MALKLLLPPRTPRLPLVLEPDNPDAHTLLAAVERAAPSASTILSESSMPPPSQPTSFADDRYQVKSFLGEGGKKTVYLPRTT